jgi:hypothetical protein
LTAATPRIESLSASSAAGKVSVRFNLAGAFDDRGKLDELQSGLATGFTYVIEVFRDRPNWFDEGIARSRIEILCTFNSVTREYVLNYRRDNRLVRSETFSDVDTLKRRMTSIDEPALFDIGRRPPYKVKVRAKADLTHGWVMYVVPWTESTHWREARVRAESKP